MGDLAYLLPEGFVALTLAFVVVSEISRGGHERVRLHATIAWVGLASALCQAVLGYLLEPARLFGGTLSHDGFSLFFKILAILAGLALVISGRVGGGTREIPAERQAEWIFSVLGAVIACCVAGAATSLFATLLALALWVVTAAVAASLGRPTDSAPEKTLISGSLAVLVLGLISGLLLHRFGTVDYFELRARLAEAGLGSAQAGVLVSLVLLSLSIPLTVFPGAFWVTDATGGAAAPASGHLILFGRLVGFASLIRVALILFARSSPSPGQHLPLESWDWTTVFASMAGITILTGALLALRQDRAKRLLAALVVSQSGMALLGVLVLRDAGVSAVLFQLLVEALAIPVAIYAIGIFSDQTRSDSFADWRGLLLRATAPTLALVVALFCVAGIPPAPSFLPKLQLLGAAVRQGWWALGVIALVGWLICGIAVLRLCFVVMLPRAIAGEASDAAGRSPSAPWAEIASEVTMPSSRVLLWTLFGMIAPLALTSVLAEWVLQWTTRSLNFILW